jgi:xylan 1,4-beta-xylosidase
MKNKLLFWLVLIPFISEKGIAQTSKQQSNPKQSKLAVQERVIDIDFKKTAGPLNTFFKECVGAGRANEGLRADWQQQLAYVKKECGFKYIRMHGLLTDDMAVYKEDSKGNPEYNYMYIDPLFDFLHSIGMNPFVELGFMPSALASGQQTIFWWRGNVTPLKTLRFYEP